MKEKIIITDVPESEVARYKTWANSLGGKMISVAEEPDQEFTIVIVFPE
jgi:hypothetical protein